MERAELARVIGVSTSAGSKAVRVVEESDPARFMATFAEAVRSGQNVFLADPNWGTRQREELAATLVQEVQLSHADSGRGWLMIPSGGTSGRLKFARHDGETLTAAVSGFCRHFGFERVNAVGLLPLHHVSGLMAWMRCRLTGGEYLPWDWKRLERGDRPLLDAAKPWVISLVPTQLQRLLESADAVAWLKGFAMIFVGGGPSWNGLLTKAAEQQLPLSLTYGMTETAAMVTALRPAEFAGGARSSGTSLPHASVAIEDDGRIVVGGASLFRGYYPGWRDASPWRTDDLGEIDGKGHLRVLGRCDDVIITGGKKVQPAEVEAALRASGEFDDVAVVGMNDSEWGQAVVACYPAGGRPPELTRAVEALAVWQRPKRFLPMKDWPRNAQGKVDRAGLRAALGQQ